MDTKLDDNILQFALTPRTSRKHARNASKSFNQNFIISCAVLEAELDFNLEDSRDYQFMIWANLGVTFPRWSTSKTFCFPPNNKQKVMNKIKSEEICIKLKYFGGSLQWESRLSEAENSQQLNDPLEVLSENESCIQANYKPVSIVNFPSNFFAIFTRCTWRLQHCQHTKNWVHENEF